MPVPKIVHGQFHCGADCVIGENVVVDVDEEVVFGDRCVIPDNTRFEGRSVRFGDDFYGYSWEWKRLDVGRGRRGEEHATLTVGSRCTFHDNRIDLARSVTIGDDVGLSPEVVIYTHYYWGNPFEGFPVGYFPVSVGSGTLVGFRATLLPGVTIGKDCLIGTGSVVTSGDYQGRFIYGGNPARAIKMIVPLSDGYKIVKYHWVLDQFPGRAALERRYPGVKYRGMVFDLSTGVIPPGAEEDEFTDDFRWHLFRHGFRFYTKRPFCKLER